VADARGLFLVIDGPDGGGKSTQCRRLAERLEGAGRAVERVRDPGDTPAGERIRALLLDPAAGELDATTELLLYQAARRRLVVERIRPALAAGRVVVCDRWHYATTAYQGGGGGVEATAIRVTTRIATDGLEPRRAILLDVDETVALRRMDRPLDRMERRDAEFRRRVRAAFRATFAGDPDRLVMIDANRPEDEVARDVWHAVQDLV
jgi:dTMP kinase